MCEVCVGVCEVCDDLQPLTTDSSRAFLQLSCGGVGVSHVIPGVGHVMIT